MTPVQQTAAFVRQDFLAAMSYRARMLLSLAGLVIMTIPVYFVAQALQPTMAETIESQGGQYFAFVVVGMAVYRLLQVVVDSLSRSFTVGIRTGTLEALFATPTGLSPMVAGMMGYPILWAAFEVLVLLGFASFLGADFVLGHSIAVFSLIVLLLLAYLPFGLLAAAAYLVFRTNGSIPIVVGVGSIFLGGVYYPTEAIPSWIEHVSKLIPLTYGLRAIRKVFLDGASLTDVQGDVFVLLAFVAVMLSLASLLFMRALRYARHTGSLAQY
jgi:ABC-2 type transport system permease protein